ncbi:hypothetical protein A6B39_10995 [Mannheimia granulomatis]|uniref:DMT family transporter n=1 Tax=Mannheimia granulomatis TaxID=85402 RepID=UPI00159DBFD4|nr:DMT family transporter [Mannheimia granulomatis]QLB15938.1 hypothetical protein A6B39_10995 [Mannheimia granulomatis]
MQLILILLVVLAGMGLSIEAGLLGPLGQQVGHLWATFSIFGVGTGLTFLLMLFFAPRNAPSFFAQPSLQLTGGILGVGYVVFLTMAVPVIGIAMAMIAILAGQIGKSLLIDHFGWLGNAQIEFSYYRLGAVICLGVALYFIYQSNRVSEKL